MIKKMIELIKYWGIINLITKAYEKMILDPKRYDNIQYANNIETGEDNYENIKQVSSNDVIKIGDVELNKSETILYLTHQFYPLHQGGTEIFTKNIAIGMQSLGYKVIVVTLDYENKKEYTYNAGDIMYRTYKYESIDVIGFRYRKSPKGMLYKQLDDNNLAMHKFAEQIIDKYQPAFVHCTYPQPMISFLGKCYERKIPYIVTLTDFNIACHYATKVNKHGEFCQCSNEGTKCQAGCKTYIIEDFIKRYRTAKECLERADNVIVPSEFTAQVISSEFPGLKLWVIPHGISEFRKTSLKTVSNNIEYAYIGKLSTIKGVYELIEAFKEANIENATLNIYGTGAKWYIKKLEKLIGADKRILLKGQIPHAQMDEVYGKTKVVVVPSLWYETYNYVAREAITAGCLVIGSNRGAIKEAITEETGWIVDMASKTALFETLKMSEKRERLESRNRYQTINGEVLRYQQLYAKSIELKYMEERKA